MPDRKKRRAREYWRRNADRLNAKRRRKYHKTKGIEVEATKDARWRPGEEGCAIGTELLAAYFEWVMKQHAPEGEIQDLPGFARAIVMDFQRWLLTTGDGAVALARINDCPRQLFLPFPDEERPYVTPED